MNRIKIKWWKLASNIIKIINRKDRNIERIIEIKYRNRNGYCINEKNSHYLNSYPVLNEYKLFLFYVI